MVMGRTVQITSSSHLNGRGGEDWKVVRKEVMVGNDVWLVLEWHVSQLSSTSSGKKQVKREVITDRTRRIYPLQFSWEENHLYLSK